MFHSFTSAKAFAFSLPLMLAVEIMHHRYGSCKTSQAELLTVNFYSKPDLGPSSKIGE